jgi:hypothetical protein
MSTAPQERCLESYSRSGGARDIAAWSFTQSSGPRDALAKPRVGRVRPTNSSMDRRGMNISSVSTLTRCHSRCSEWRSRRAPTARSSSLERVRHFGCPGRAFRRLEASRPGGHYAGRVKRCHRQGDSATQRHVLVARGHMMVVVDQGRRSLENSWQCRPLAAVPGPRRGSAPCGCGRWQS